MKPQPPPERTAGKSLRMIGYVRVSTDEQAASGTSLDSQEVGLKALAEAEGYEVVRIVRDEGVSGSTSERPGLRHVLSAVRSGEVGCARRDFHRPACSKAPAHAGHPAVA